MLFQIPYLQTTTIAAVTLPATALPAHRTCGRFWNVAKDIAIQITTCSKYPDTMPQWDQTSLKSPVSKNAKISILRHNKTKN